MPAPWCGAQRLKSASSSARASATKSMRAGTSRWAGVHSTLNHPRCHSGECRNPCCEASSDINGCGNMRTWIPASAGMTPHFGCVQGTPRGRRGDESHPRQPHPPKTKKAGQVPQHRSGKSSGNGTGGKTGPGDGTSTPKRYPYQQGGAGRMGSRRNSMTERGRSREESEPALQPQVMPPGFRRKHGGPISRPSAVHCWRGRR